MEYTRLFDATQAHINAYDDNPIIEHRFWIQAKDKSKIDIILIKK